MENVDDNINFPFKNGDLWDWLHRKSSENYNMHAELMIYSAVLLN